MIRLISIDNQMECPEKNFGSIFVEILSFFFPYKFLFLIHALEKREKFKRTKILIIYMPPKTYHTPPNYNVRTTSVKHHDTFDMCFKEGLIVSPKVSFEEIFPL